MRFLAPLEMTSGSRFLVVEGVAGGFGQCDCEGCTLVIDFPDGSNDNSMSEQELLNELATKDLFMNDLENFVFRKFSTGQYGIKRLDFTPTDNSNYYIQYEIVTEKGETESVMYVYRSDGSNPQNKL